MKAALLLTIASLFAGAAGAQDSETVLGRWRSLKTSGSGVGAMYEFHPDGTIDYSRGAIVELNYRVEGKFLFLSGGPGNAAEQKSKLEWTGGANIRITSASGETEEYHRTGPIQDPDQPILGEWIGTRETAGKRVAARFLFSSSGKALRLVPYMTERGKYWVHSGRMSTSFPKEDALDGAYTVQHGLLTVAQSPGRVEEFLQY